MPPRKQGLGLIFRWAAVLLNGTKIMSSTLELLKAALAQASDPTALAKAATFTQPTSATTGLQDYDLSPAVLNLYPMLTPLRNMIPRVSGKGGIQANWRAVTAIDTGSVRVGVSEGHRGSVIGVSTKEFFAAYRTLGTEAAVTDEATLASADFDDVRARAANSGLQALMLAEEKIILGGNTSLNLGTTPTPVLVASGVGGSLPATSPVSVICVALTFEGRNYSSLAMGIPGLVTRTTADSFTESFGGGSARRSNAAQVTTSASTTNSVLCTVAAVKGAYSYAWFSGAPGSEALFDITYINQTTLKAFPVGTMMIAALGNGDNSTNTLIHDGLLTQAALPDSGAGYVVMPAGQGLTPDGSGGIVEFDAILQDFYDRLRLSPSHIWISSQESIWLRRKILATGPAATQARFTFQTMQGQVTGGGAVKGYINPFAMTGGPAEIPLHVHPNMPPGTVLFLTDSLPYAVNNIENILQIRSRRPYYQTEWPKRTRAYEYGVYSDQVLQNMFMPGMTVLTNIAAA